MKARPTSLKVMWLMIGVQFVLSREPAGGWMLATYRLATLTFFIATFAFFIGEFRRDKRWPFS